MLKKFALGLTLALSACGNSGYVAGIKTIASKNSFETQKVLLHIDYEPAYILRDSAEFNDADNLEILSSLLKSLYSNELRKGPLMETLFNNNIFLSKPSIDSHYILGQFNPNRKYDLCIFPDSCQNSQGDLILISNYDSDVSLSKPTLYHELLHDYFRYLADDKKNAFTSLMLRLFTLGTDLEAADMGFGTDMPQKCGVKTSIDLITPFMHAEGYDKLPTNEYLLNLNTVFWYARLRNGLSSYWISSKGFKFLYSTEFYKHENSPRTYFIWAESFALQVNLKTLIPAFDPFYSDFFSDYRASNFVGFGPISNLDSLEKIESHIGVLEKYTNFVIQNQNLRNCIVSGL